MNRPKELEKGISDIVGVFTDPIIVHRSGWMDMVPDWVKQQITLERLIMNIKSLRGEEPTGTDAEALAYLIPASFEAPMGHDWTEIYLYLGTKVCEAGGKGPMPDDIRRDTLNDDQMRDLNRLKAWIYRKRRDVRLDRERAARRQEKEEERARREEKEEEAASLQQKFDLGLDKNL
ncbi:hypothetical protein ES703_40168 [subsurface metagenome]